MSKEVLDFIHHARQKGMDHATIRVLLLSAGWREKEVAKALAEEGLDFAVPEPPGSGGAKETFQYLIAFTALCVLLSNVVYLFFKFLDRLLPDPAETPESLYFDYHQTTIRWSMAMVIVAFPLFVGITRWIGRDIQRGPEKSKSAVRKWLTHLALFAAAMTMMIDGVSLVYGFLQGELTTRFVLKVLVVLVAAVAVFYYYLMALRIPDVAPASSLPKLDWSFAIVSVVLAGLSVAAGATIVESPFTARLRRLDNRRVADLRDIESAMRRYAVEAKDREQRLKRPLPGDLAELARFVRDDEHARELSLVDPQTGKRYEYSVVGSSQFKLCAEFALDDRREYPPEWTHPAGKHCFTVDLLSHRD